ncbi:MAG TPA: MlaE family lipid ABC transporter permease subunit [Thermodesulfobacteriota bacterium]|nr:MlaE family lipid ABC transporter permease subunit [Thermodesulfobacteriota bacterium]
MMKENHSSSINAQMNDEGNLNLTIHGHLDSYTIGDMWRKAVQILERTSPKKVIVDASGINYCDGSGIALFVKLREQQERAGRKFEVRNFANEFQQLLDLFPSGEIGKQELEKLRTESVPEEIGRATVNILDEIRANVTFIGEAGIALFYALLNPRSIRWSDVFLTSEKIGVNAFSIIALVNFLVGLVIAFQSAIPLKKYGGTLFVADLLVLSVFRELGPLMTAIVVNGRSGSAFAAEIGTMKVNEEVDALTTMGLDPVRFLVVPKVIASLFMIPILTVFGNLFGLLGGGVVMLALGFPPVAYVNEMVYAASYVDLLGGLFKSLFFAAIIAGVGCLEGLRTKTGAAAVGDSTTRAVVAGIVLIIFIDGIFGVIFYYLGI